VLRKCGRGTFVVVSSWAGWQYSGFAGAAYSASKAALAPFVESINDQEGQNGLRATLICPAEVATPLMAVRPNPPNAVDLARMLDPEDVASAVLFAIQAPPKICINQLVISPVWNRIYCEPEKLRPIRKT
jgi:NADP-dependent 3-hydroxy acid dehydrogenase YdfG